ncbi:MAG: phosphocholine cytidylyltransferase family protein [Xanthomonadales bacterium]|nr:phosphocholine cytidylyltransferase family protein [Xanthomonadales bacterium]NNK50664.1 phosphocholine cytidylyltransferase family protein [Xanthomonadales bacterium]
MLSAGQGRRLMPLTEVTPKCCLSPGGVSILEWQITQLAVSGIEEVVVVTGFGHEVVQAVVDNIEGIKVRTLYNPFFRLSDNLGTCWVARGEMEEPFLLINGDTLFEAAVLQHLLTDADHYPITLATDQKNRYDSDDMKIWSERDRLCRVGKTLDLSHVNGESIGMMLFSRTGAEIFVHKVEELMRIGDGLNRWYLSAIDELAQTGIVGVSSIHGLSWCEVDDPVDLAHAEQVVKTWPVRPPSETGGQEAAATGQPRPSATRRR